MEKELRESIDRGFQECIDVIMETRKRLYFLTDEEAAKMREEILNGTYRFDAHEKYKDRKGVPEI